MTVGIYIRVSTEEQVKEGYSISAQREKLKAFCTAQSWDNFKFYIEEGVSGRTAKRPRLNELLEHIKEGKIQTLLVYRLDRLTRSVRDLHKLLDTLDKHGCTFKSATEVYDTSTAMGRMFITIIASIAQWESENLGERVRMGQIEKARQGYWSAQAPYGFDKVEKRLVINEKEKEVILDMIDKVEKGYSVRKLANYLNDSGIQTVRGYKWHIRSILNMLTNPALYGSMVWREEIIDNTHEGIISKKEFTHLKELISSRQNFKQRNVSSLFIYQMKIKCPHCGNRLSSERSVYLRKTDNVQVETNNYRCQVCALARRSPVYRISEKNMNMAFEEYMEGLMLVKSQVVREENKTEDDIKSIERNIIKIENQRIKYQRAWSQDLISDEEFAERMQETQKSITGLNDMLEDLTDEKTPEINPALIKEIAINFDENWEYLTQQERRDFVQRFISSFDVEQVSGTEGRGYRDHVHKITGTQFVN